MWKLLENIGFEPIEKSVRETGTILADKTVPNTLTESGVKGNHAMSASTFFWPADQLAFGGIGFIIKELTPNRVVYQQAPYGRCFYFNEDINIDPTKVPELPKLCQAYTDFERKACRPVNPKIKYTITQLVSRGDPCCEVIFELPEEAEINFDERKPGKRTGLQQGIQWDKWPIERRYRAACR